MPTDQAAGKLLTDIRTLIDSARGHVAQAVNAGLVRLYWNVGRRIGQDILKEERAEYGEKIVQTLSAQLKRDYGDGFGRRNLFNMVRFAEVFPDAKIVQTLSGQLGWSHFSELISMADSLKRDFYTR